MEWTRSDTLALAMHKCSNCRGTGIHLGRKGQSGPCQCVLRRIFRLCFRRFQECVTKEKFISRLSLEMNGGGSRRITWSRKNEEYSADFILVTKRSLSENEYRMFRYHFLLGADWRLCSKKLGLDRGDYFHEMYRIEQKLGRIYRELKPYALFPIDEYFNVSTRAHVDPTVMESNVVPIRPPLAGDCQPCEEGGEEENEHEAMPVRKVA